MNYTNHLVAGVVFVLASVSNVALAAEFSGRGEVSRVIVFQNRASVTRTRTLTLPPGSHSVSFEEVTNSMDTESIKVKVQEGAKIMVLGVRVATVNSLHSRDKDLNELRKKNEKLENARRNLLAQVKGLIQQDQSLEDLTKHYEDSFTYNLHKKGWKKNDLKGFISFLESHASKMNATWKDLYQRSEALSKELDYTSAKISERAPASEHQSKTVWVNLTAESAGPVTLQIQYLVGNASWTPAYDLKIHSASQDADLIQKAMVRQNTGEDWSRVNLSLSNVRTELKTNPPDISTYTLNYQEVKEVKTGVVSETQDTGSLNVGSDDGVDKEQKKETGLGRIFPIAGVQSIRDGMAKTAVTIAIKKMKYTEALEVVSSQYRRVYRKAEFTNQLNWDLAAGPMSIYHDNQFIQQTKLPKVARAGQFAVNIGIDHDVLVTRSQMDKVEEPGLIDKKRHFLRSNTTSLENFSGTPKKIWILERGPVSELKDVEVSVKDSTPGFKKEGKIEGWYKWEVSVPARTTASVDLKMDVAVPKDFQFAW